MGSRDDPLSMYMCDVVTLPANLAGMPGISVPCGFVDGLPVGLQVHRAALRGRAGVPGGARVRAGDGLAHALALCRSRTEAA